MKTSGVLFGALAVLALAAPAKADLIFDTRTGIGLDASGIAFANGLYEGYAELSRGRVKATDLIDGEHFNHKARRAARRSDVMPDEIMDRDLTEQDAAQLAAALTRLRTAFDRGGRSLAPAESARAQVSYDCWIEAAEGANPNHGMRSWSAFRTDDVARCKTAFEEAIAAVERAANLELTPFRRPAGRPAMAAAPAPAPAPMPTEAPKPFVVYFGFDSTQITTAGMRVIDDAVATAERLGIVDFSITGHADRSGPEEYNLGLSLRRANVVRDALIARGVKASGISVAGRGEAEPAVSTADGVREPANRRVEIILL
ncbi:MAG: OmpA family protein [Kiloniellaceae bacterium]